MNERIQKLYGSALDKAVPYTWHNLDHVQVEGVMKEFAELIVRECTGLIHLECKDFANGNCFHDDVLWKSVTTEYGKNKERGFDPLGMSIHFEKILKQHFGVGE